MSNPSQTDEWIVESLRNAEVPAPPPGLTSQMVRLRPRRRFVKWLAASGFASMAGILVISGTLHPTSSLAQVAAAQADQKEYTIVNTRLLSSSKQIQITECRDGNRWARHAVTLDVAKSSVKPSTMPTLGVFGDTVMDGKRTIMIKHLPPVMDIVEIDEGTPMIQAFLLDIHKLLQTDGKVSKSLGETWRGRKVDRFVVHKANPDKGSGNMFDRTVIADAVTHLPLRVENSDPGELGVDIWEFRYQRPAESAFDVKISPKATIYDLPKERLELRSVLKRGAVFVNVGQTAQVLLPHSGDQIRLVLPVKVDGSPARLQANLLTRLQPGAPEAILYRIDGKAWELANLTGLPFDDAKNFKPFQGKNVSLKIAGHQLSNVPVFHVSLARSLLRPFVKE
jgi:hypothetical protein